jgi:hypothetical protein
MSSPLATRATAFDPRVTNTDSANQIGSRMNRNRKPAARALTLAAIVLVMILSACDRPSAGPAATPGGTATPTGVTTPTIAATPTAGDIGQAAVSHGVPDSAFAKSRPFTGPALVEYGQAALQSAYKEMVNFAFATGWNSVLIARNSAYLSRADLAVAASYMTAAARKDMLTTLAKVTQGDKAATSKLEESIFFGLTGPGGLKSVQSGKVVTNRKFTQGSTTVDTSHGTRLVLSFAARGDIQMVDAAGVRQMLRTTRVLRFLLVPNSGADRQARPFLIDSWSSKMTMNSPVVAS